MARRATPELDQVRAHLATLVPYRIAAGVLEHFLPVEAGITHETLRGCTLKLGEEVRDAAPVQPAVAASAITVSVDSTYIRSCEDGQRHLEVRLGKGTSRSWGSGSPGQVGDGIDFGIEQRFEAGSELAVEDSALEQEISTAAGPPHLL